jgi:hypothetical protein
MRAIMRRSMHHGVLVSPAAESSDRMSEAPAFPDNPYAPPQTIDHSSRGSFIPVFGLFFGIAVWLLFLVSLVLPGAAPVEGWNRPATKAFHGYVCALVYWPYYPSNLLMATLPLWLIATAIWPFRRWATQLIFWFLILSGFGTWGLYGSLFRDIGYWLWSTLFFVAALAWMMISFTPNHRLTTFELTSHLRKR